MVFTVAASRVVAKASAAKPAKRQQRVAAAPRINVAAAGAAAAALLFADSALAAGSPLPDLRPKGTVAEATNNSITKDGKDALGGGRIGVNKNREEICFFDANLPCIKK